jgi:hypothetical protein
MLLPLADEVWTLASPQRFAGMELGSRMTVVRLPDRSLVLHSPVAPSEGTLRELVALGVVRALVAPNLLHHLHLRAYLDAFPSARVYGGPGLARKRPDLRVSGVLGSELEPWAPTLRHRLIEGNPTHEEVVTFHPASRSLLVADLVGNLRKLRGLRMRLLGRLNGWGRFGAPHVLRLLVRDRRAARRSLDAVLRWDFDRIVLTHGEILDRGGREALARAFAWLGA